MTEKIKAAMESFVVPEEFNISTEAAEELAKFFRSVKNEDPAIIQDVITKVVNEEDDAEEEGYDWKRIHASLSDAVAGACIKNHDYPSQIMGVLEALLPFDEEEEEEAEEEEE